MFFKKIFSYSLIAIVFISSAFIFPSVVNAEEKIYVKSDSPNMSLTSSPRVKGMMSNEILLTDNFENVAVLNGAMVAIKNNDFKSWISFNLPTCEEVGTLGGISTMTFPSMKTLPRTYFHEYENISAHIFSAGQNKVSRKVDLVTVRFELARNDENRPGRKIGEGFLTVIDKNGNVLFKEAIMATKPNQIQIIKK